MEAYVTDFKVSTLWNRLVTKIATTVKDHGSFDFFELEGFDSHETYPMSNLILVQETADTSLAQLLRVRLALGAPLPVPGYPKANAWHPVVVTIF